MDIFRRLLRVLFVLPKEENLAQKEKEERVAAMVALCCLQAQRGRKSFLFSEVWVALYYTDMRMSESTLRSVLDQLVDARFVVRTLSGDFVRYALTRAGEDELWVPSYDHASTPAA